MPWLGGRAGTLALCLFSPFAPAVAVEEEDLQAWWRDLYADLDARCGARAGTKRQKPGNSAGCGVVDRWNYAVALSDLGRASDSARELRAIVRKDKGEEEAFRFMARRRLAEELLHVGEADAAHEVLEKMLSGKLDASQRHTLSVLLRATELALRLERPSKAMQGLDAEYALLSRSFASKYAGWGSEEAEIEAGLTVLAGAPTADELAGFVFRRQPFRIDAPSGAPAGDAAAAGLRALGLPKALAAFKPAKLAARAGDELVFAQVVKVTGHKDERSAARAVFAYDNEHHRRVFCNFSAVLADLYGASAVGIPGERSCLSERMGQPPPDGAAAAGDTAAAAKWRMYMSIQANLLPPLPDDEPYSRPLHRIKRDLPRPKFLKRFPLQTVNTWMGRGPTRSMLHHDRYDTLYVLLQGWKRFRIFPPSEAAAVKTVHPPSRVSPSGTITYATSVAHKHILESGEFSHLVRTDLGLGSPFLDEATELRGRGLEVELRPGQALFLPGYWFHEVESKGEDEGGMGPHAAVSFDISPPDDVDERTLQARRKAGGASKRRGRRRRKRSEEL